MRRILRTSAWSIAGGGQKMRVGISLPLTLMSSQNSIYFFVSSPFSLTFFSPWSCRNWKLLTPLPRKTLILCACHFPFIGRYISEISCSFCKEDLSLAFYWQILWRPSALPSGSSAIQSTRHYLNPQLPQEFFFFSSFLPPTSPTHWMVSDLALISRYFKHNIFSVLIHIYMLSSTHTYIYAQIVFFHTGKPGVALCLLDSFSCGSWEKEQTQII